MMSSFLSDFLLLLAATNAGLIAGYFLPRKDFSIKSNEPDRLGGGEKSASAKLVVADRSADFMLAVQQVTEDVAARVGAHSQQVQAISTELQADGCDVAAILSRLISANDSMEKQLESAESRLKDQAAMIELHVTEARTDALTGLANRRAFDDEIQKHFKAFESHGTPATLLMLDIDFFKKLNDTFGHLAGDDVLKSTAALLAKAVRSSDIVARYGGEEFAVILPEATALSVLRNAEQLREAFSQFSKTIDKKAVNISASAGMAGLLPGDSIKAWIQRADEALYHAKSQGRDCGFWHDGKSLQRIGQPAEEKPPVPEVKEVKPVDETERQLISLSTFNNCLAMMLAENQRDGQNLSVVMVRVDQADTITERYNAETVQSIYEKIGRMLMSRVGLKSHVAYFGNDSFGIIMPNTRMDEAVVTGLRIRNAISATPIEVLGKGVEVSVSMGVGDEHRRGPKRPLIDRVKEAVAAASKLGGNQVVASKGDGFVQVSNSPGQSRKICAV